MKTFELREGYVALVISHADYYALMRILESQSGNPEAERLIPVLRVEGLEPSPAKRLMEIPRSGDVVCHSPLRSALADAATLLRSSIHPPVKSANRKVSGK